MSYELNPAEVRVLGCLLEKDQTTPDHYPLSLNALTDACNQKTNRDPVVSYQESKVQEAVESLRAKKLVQVIAGYEIRVPKYGHSFSEAFNLGRGEMALIAVLLLRGPQTVGELRGRTQRMHSFDGLDVVESTLRRLQEREPPLARKMARQPGWKESRYMHLLAGEVEAALPEAEPSQLETRLETLEKEVADLRQQLTDFRKQFE